MDKDTYWFHRVEKNDQSAPQVPYDEDEQRIIENVKEALSRSPARDKKGVLQIQSGEWLPLRIAVKQSPQEPGIYALGLSQGIRYDNAASRIVYLGSASDLRKRFAQHAEKPHNQIIELLFKNFPDDIRGAWWAIPGFDRDFLYGIEGEAIQTFERRFGVLPIGNLSIPEFFEGQEYCSGLVDIVACDVACPMTLEELARHLDRVLFRTEVAPAGSFVFSISLTNGFPTVPNEKFKRVALLTREEAEQESQSKKKLEEDRRYETGDDDEEYDYSLSFVQDVNLAAWSPEKMQEVINLCNQLKPKRTKAKTVKPFEAPFREVPVPHTWGEIALIQARIVGGSWQPDNQIWVKVHYGKEVLGEGKLNKGWYFGEDKSDLPQRRSPRPRSCDFELEDEPIREMDEIEEVREVYGLEVSTFKRSENANFRQSTDEWERAREEAKQLRWQDVENLFQQALKEINS